MMPHHRIRPGSSRRTRQSGAVLVEFALVAFAFYLLIASIITFGGMINTSQVAQDAARAGARELALTPLSSQITFEQALATPAVKSRVYDPDRLVIDLDDIPGGDLDAYFATLPVVNRALRTAMISDIVEISGTHHRILRFPGALLRSPTPPNPAAGITGFTVGVPIVVSRAANGVETIEWVSPVEEVRPDRNDPTTGPFRAVSPFEEHGLVALRINVPYQSAAMSSYRVAPGGDPLAPNGNLVNEANDAAVAQINAPAFGTLIPQGSINLTYTGRFGLGRQEALARRVRPYRRVLIGQAFFRRELYAEQSQ